LILQPLEGQNRSRTKILMGVFALIQVIYGKKGTGKGKRIMEMANAAANTALGSIVYVTLGTQHMYDIPRDIRYVDASAYHIEGPKMFYGFMTGMAAQDFDLEYIFVDGFMKIVKHPLNTLDKLFEELNRLTETRGIRLVLTASGEDEEAPEFLKPYLI